MHKIWQGLDPHLVLAAVGTFVSATVLVIHIFAFSVVGYPASTKAKYNPQAASAQMR
jgi:hypothetical protein